jgi:hypothetical protein
MAKQPQGVPTATQKPDINLRQAQAGFLGCDQYVAGGGKRQPGTKRWAVQRGDHRLAAFDDGVEALPRATAVLPARAGLFPNSPAGS